MQSLEKRKKIESKKKKEKF